MSTATTEPAAAPPKSPLQEITQPFIDLVHAPRALWGVNIGYFIEGMVYFGILGYLAIYFSDTVFAGVENADVHSHRMVMVLTAGITLSMFFLGFVGDKWGVRRALLIAFVLLLVGRIVISTAGSLNLRAGLWSPLHLATMAGILIIVVGYGMYQPAAYAAVRQFTTPKTAGMSFAMLYALMNLGGYLPSFAWIVRDEGYLNQGIIGAFWVYTGFTLLALLCTVLILSRSTVDAAIAAARVEKEQAGAAAATSATQEPSAVKRDFWEQVLDYVRHHPLTNLRFAFFIFVLIPVQTLFTYNWLVLPQYISRAYEGWIGEKFELAANLNPLLIFVLVPIIAAATQKYRVYNMILIGTFVMAAPAFLLALGPSAWTLFGYLVIMTIGEAMWQPRFLQYAAELAPEGRTGQYMGVAQLPWFLTKMLVPALYSGAVMARYCPAEGPKDTETMWLIFGCIAMVTPVLLLLAKPWVGKHIKGSSN